MLTKRPAGDDSHDPNEVVPILASPLPGQEMQAVVTLLQNGGVTGANQLSSSILSANVPRRLLPQLRTVARVEIKHAKDMH